MRRDPRAAVVISWINNLTDGRPATALVTVPVSELLELKVALLTEAPPEDPDDDAPTHAHKKRQRKPKGMTSRSKLRRRPDTPYLNFVRQHPCCSCGTTRNVEAHHEGSKAQKGMGMKVPDSETVPLCDRCHKHDGFHRWGSLPGLTREQTKNRFATTKRSLQAEWAKRKDTF